MDNIFNDKKLNTGIIFNSYYIEAAALYTQLYNTIPNQYCFESINGEKLFEAIKKDWADNIQHVFERSDFNQQKKKFAHNQKIIICKNNLLIELDQDYGYLYHSGEQTEMINRFALLALANKEKQRRKPLEINLVVSTKRGLELKGMEIKRIKLDLQLFYENDFIETDAVIQKRLRNKNDKGIVLLHGLPGTGKTTYLRHLVGKLKKRVLFLSPGVAGNLMNPDFIELLIDNPNSILVIEDAENIIMDRKYSSSSSVSNLLNISDGLLADFLNVQIICTFNSSLTMIDNALLRKGRLIAQYEFGKLGTDKAQALSKHFGFGTLVKEPMSIAEIANQHETKKPLKQKERVIGFRMSGVEV
ncbi:AAA family ATPase [Niabella ginsengisoli]|uniref:AAA family ATPase n=1 Tax=Niabella ginsengisoli TaxID=522298 RepID=A0ABS9SR36_9BACT|nr:AAA family ATPase [Niabella ginsengisoli]MCH5600850.1 AAA family ATPase [Niabella ginsengisoli]